MHNTDEEFEFVCITEQVSDNSELCVLQLCDPLPGVSSIDKFKDRVVV